MVTRAVQFVVSVDGASETGAAFLELARQEREAEKASRELQREQQRGREQLQRFGQAANETGRALHMFAQALESTRPQTSRFLEFTSQLATSLGRNVTQFGAWGGAAVTALEASHGPLTAAIDGWAHLDEMIQSARTGLSGYSDALDRLMQIGDASVGVSQGARGPLSAAARERARVAALPMGIDPNERGDFGNEEARGAIVAHDLARFRREARGRGGESMDDRVDAFYDREREGMQSVIDAQRTYEEQRTEIQNQLQENAAAHREQVQAQELAFQEQLNAIQEQTHANQLRRLEQQREAHANLRNEIQAYTTPLVGGFTKAISSVIAGSESADQAFQGMLSSFLQFISQQAALKAAFEFAEAIASFPNPATMASHAAAGIAFTAVAVAAGAGAIATAPSAPAGDGRPASPQRGAEGMEGGGAAVIVHWNSPMIMIGQADEVGRGVGRVVARSDRRFASTV